MDTHRYTAPRLPSILLIDGREHVLCDEFVGRLRVERVTRLWMTAALTWAYVAGLALWLALDESFDLWQALLVLLLNVMLYLINRSAVIPVSVVENERDGTISRLSISAHRHHTLTATVHTDMADYLLRAITADRPRRVKPHWEVPVELAYPWMRRNTWISTAGVIVAIPLLVALVSRLFLP